MPAATARYNRYYIGITDSGQTNNSVVFRPRKEHVRLGVKVSDMDAWAERLEGEGMALSEARSDGRLTIRLSMSDLARHRDSLRELFIAAYKVQED